MTSFSTTSRLGVQDKTSVDYDQSRSTGYGKMCNVDLGLLVITDQESGNRPHPLANIRRMRQPLVTCAILKQSTPITRRRVLLSEGPNQYKIALSLCLIVIFVCYTSITIAFLAPDLLTEQLNHSD
jgi:hypothetical protein